MKKQNLVNRDSRRGIAGELCGSLLPSYAQLCHPPEASTSVGALNSPLMEVNQKPLLTSKKLKKGDHTISLSALCADGTLLETSFPVSVQTITDPLQKFYIYGEDPEAQPAFKPGAWDAACMRFSDNEGKFTDVNGNPGFLPYLSDDIYWGLKTLIFEITDATDDCAGRIMNGWWSARYDGDQDVKFTNGLWELPLTEAIAKDCARGNGGDGKDLDLMVTSGSCTIHSIYYEE